MRGVRARFPGLHGDYFILAVARWELQFEEIQRQLLQNLLTIRFDFEYLHR